MKQSLTNLHPEDNYLPIYNVELEAILWWDSLNENGKRAVVQKYMNSQESISREGKEIIQLYRLTHNSRLFS